MSEVWFIRHGESKSNAGEVVPHRANVGLTEKGHMQAKGLIDVFVKSPDLIVMTPFIRTQQTAEPIRKKYSNAPSEIWDLHEFCCLSDENYCGTTVHERGPKTEMFWKHKDPDYIDGEGAESFSQMIERINMGFDKLRQREEDFIAIFTHGLVMHTMSVLMQSDNLSAKEVMERVIERRETTSLDNCEIIRAKADTSGIRMHESHLDILAVG